MKKKNKPKKKVQTLSPIRPNRTTELEYQRALIAFGKKMGEFMKNKLTPVLKDGQQDYVYDSVVDDVSKVLKEFEKRFMKSDKFAINVSNKFINKVYSQNTKKFEEQIKDKFGVDIFKNKRRLQRIVKAKVNENVNLIKTQADIYFKDISTAVYEGITEGVRASEISKDLANITGKMTRHIKFIAGDQVQKANAAINEAEQREVGVSEYIWRTSEDQRVRGDPKGLYPNAEHNHFERNGKSFEWDKPPAGGHPGQDYGCRCTAEAIIDFEYED
jgi:SPP1 gp7 family putative phage head morphogenesis protein